MNTNGLSMNRLLTDPLFKDMNDLLLIPTPTEIKGHAEQPQMQANLNQARLLLNQKLEALGPASIVQEAGSLIAHFEGKGRLKNIQPLLLTAHFDMVPASLEHPTKAVQPRLIVDGSGKVFIGTDGNTTLGADDKAGIAIILSSIKQMQQQPDMPPLEILLSPDEEGSGESLLNIKTKRLKSQYAIVLDEFTSFKITNQLASNVSINIQLGGLRGGHSGFNIGDTDRLNANLLLAELMLKLKSGPIERNTKGEPVLSKNIGVVQGGSAENSIPREASLQMLLRSHSQAAQAKELDRIRTVLKQFETEVQKTDPGFKITHTMSEDYPLWQGNPSSPMIGIAQKAAQQAGHAVPPVGQFHATTQAAILQQLHNETGQTFQPIIIGPDIENAHSLKERVLLKSIPETRDWLTRIIQNYGEYQVASELTGSSGSITPLPPVKTN